MAEIYKQQIEANALDGAMLRQPQYRDYFTQGLGNVSEGFKKLGEYFQYRDDKELASKMALVAKEVDADLVHWEDFSAEGVDKFMAKSMDKYDNAMANSPYDAQNRFNTYNPEARNIFELKTKEDFLKKANEFIFEETKRDFNVIANDVSEIKDPKKLKVAMLTALDKVNENKSGMLYISQLGELTDSLGHKMSAQSIGQAIIDGRAGDAETLLGDKVFTKFLGPEEVLGFKVRIQNLKESQAKDAKVGSGYKDLTNFLIALRDGMYAMYGPNENIDATMNRITEELRSGKSLGDQIVLEWVDGVGVPLKDLVEKLGMGTESLNYWDSAPMTPKQLAINEYEKVVEPALPMEYKRRRSYLAESFTRGLENYLVEDSEGKKTIYDFTNINNNDLRDKLKDAEELQWYRIGLDNNVLKQLDSFLNAVDAIKAEAGKAASIELDPIQQNMAGFTAGKTFYGGGNLTEAMISAAQNGEEKPSVINGIMKNSVDLNKREQNKEAAKAYMSLGLEQSVSGKLDAVEKLGKALSSKDLAPTRSNLPYFDDGGQVLSNSIAAAAGRLMVSLGEVDKDGDLVVPKANTYRFMTYAIPIVLGYISVKGNEEDIKNTGIKPGVINDESVVDLILKLQNKYNYSLDDSVNSYSTTGAFRDQLGPSAPEIYGIQNSDIYNMLMDTYSLAKEDGLILQNAQPDVDAMINIAFALNNIAKDAKPLTYVPAKDSGAQKRLNYKTKAMRQYKSLTKKG